MEVVKLSFAELKYYNRYLEIEYSPDIEIDALMMKEIIGRIKLLVGNEAFVVMAVLHIGSDLSREARSLLASDQGLNIAAAAMVTKTKVAQIIALFLMRIAQPYYPIKLFNSQKEAILWVKPYYEAIHNYKSSPSKKTA